ncbi:DUF2798 domain-containing protein [uncultured Aquimarina sp.]|uniref:DUF2798 domain-containing protein n=1 Tax=uncultured Aquimarina sp. TaxID=575652 RepID=UPI00260443A7|nr:DUF2798 domain-containing protein [uncultured Aquimarina sp.]
MSNRKKLSSKFYMPIFMLLMTLFIGLSLSGIMLWMNEGSIEGFFFIWISNFFKTWIVVIPIVIITLPVVTRITKYVANSPKT